MVSFFAADHNKLILAKFRVKIDSIIPQDDFEKSRNNFIKLVINSIEKDPLAWDRNCQININWIGDNFINSLTNVNEFSKPYLDDLCAMCFRFIFEIYLSIKNELSREFEQAKHFVLTNLNSFDTNAKEQIEYALMEMPISIFKAVANSDSIENLKDFNDLSAKAKNLKETWDYEISEKEKKVNELKESLEKYENGFNFVGLFQGFDDLSKEKNDEKNNLIFWLRILSVLIIIPVFVELFVIYTNIDNIVKIKDGLIISIFPTVSLIALSLYYFRVLLFNYKSVKAQILQIELRKTLCRFIQNYADYSSTLKKQDPNSLIKFENIIFSQIGSNDENIPSTLDGIDQITNLIKSIRS